MRVSVIIPIFKVEDYIERCLLSVLHQDYEDLELILVDDCSPDRSIAIAREVLSGGGKNCLCGKDRNPRVQRRPFSSPEQRHSGRDGRFALFSRQRR